MKVLYYDCFSGISGDMNLAAMIDLGVDKDYLLNELNKLNVSGYKIEIGQDARKGITGTKVYVILDSHAEHHHYETNQQVEHHHHGEAHEHLHEYEEGKRFLHKHHHEEHHVEGHVHRNLKDIENIIALSTLSDNVKRISMDIFMRVAKAEAKIHGKALYDVHFHEVGAVDSIVDIIGAAICFDYLKVDKVMCSSIELGGGFVKCAHGLIPVPAPATIEILQGVPVKTGAVPFETTTPTGAAILAALVDEFVDKKEFVIEKTAYGIGHRDTEIPNVLRVFLAEIAEKNKAYYEIEEAYIIECNIDDMNPELYDYIINKFLYMGASDVYLTPMVMKKGRPAIKLSVLCTPDKLNELKRAVFIETSTLGIRILKVEKNLLHRNYTIRSTKFGEISVKNGYLEGELIKSKPEYEDCRKAAEEYGIPIKKVYDALNEKEDL